MRKEATPITERNGGMHSQKAYRRVRAMLAGHGYVAPRLYHLILMDNAAESASSPRRFQTAIQAICRKLRQVGIPVRWRACLERDDAKGLHVHLFLLADGNATINPDGIINTKLARAKGWLQPMLAARFMSFHLSQPKADMHRSGGTIEGKRRNYATLAGDKLADCENWLSYLVKQRSKADDLRVTYFSSRDTKAKQPIRSQ